MIIGLVGKVGSGKDTVGQILVQHCGFVRVSFAEPLRQCLLALDPYVDQFQFRDWIPLSELVTKVGWDEAKKNPEVRRLMQRIGTEMGRKILGQNFWVDLALAEMVDVSKHYVVTDCRFLNEAVALLHAGAELWRIRRGDGLPGAAGQHASEVEQERISVDREIQNTDTLEALERMVLDIIPAR